MVRSIINTAQQHANHQSGPVFKKRQDIETQMPINETLLDKRSVDEQLNDIPDEDPSNSSRIKRSNEDEDDDSESSEDNSDKVNDNELQESFKSLQRRDDEESSDNEGYEDEDNDDAPVNVDQRSYDQESGVASFNSDE